MRMSILKFLTERSICRCMFYLSWHLFQFPWLNLYNLFMQARNEKIEQLENDINLSEKVFPESMVDISPLMYRNFIGKLISFHLFCSKWTRSVSSI